MPKPTHLGLLCDVGELSASLAGSTNIDSFLQKIADLVAAHLRSDVCSIYLYRHHDETLVLRVTRGLKSKAVGQVKMGIGEGLVGKALKDLQTVREDHASAHPDYKHFAGIDEEHYEAFLAAPISRGRDRIGVIVVQRQKRRPFDDSDELALRGTAAQLASAIENVRILTAIHGEDSPEIEEAPQPPLKMVRGEVGGEGYAEGPSIVINRIRSNQLLNELVLTEHYTMEDFERALLETEAQLEHLQAEMASKLPEMAALIFSAHILMLKDDEFTGKMRGRIEGGQHAAAAILGVTREYIDLLSASANAYIREKAQDVEDLGRRLLGNLQHTLNEPSADCHNHIVVADMLFPSDILKLVSEDVAGIVLVSGGVTSHVAILARSLQIPLVIADQRRLLDLEQETFLALDGYAGFIHVAPTPDVLSRLHERNTNREVSAAAGAKMRPQTFTADGERVKLMANINLLSDLRHATELRAEGVGLYRSEFPVLVRTDFPSEDEQYPIYCKLIEQTPGDVLTFRTLDIGGDKVMAYMEDKVPQHNPNLGMRSIRFTLSHRKIFQEQLRAFLRATRLHGGRRMRLMFPMISSIDEFLLARQEVEQCRTDLVAEGMDDLPPLSLGIMVEVPSMVEILDDIAPLVDFFCIGTNDFIQFLLAVDRTNEKVAPYFLPHHPSVLRSLARIADAANRHGIEVSICGEMAHEIRYVPFLLGIGIRTLSIDPRYLPTVQSCIEGLSLAACRKEATEILRLGTEAELRNRFAPAPINQDDRD